MAPKIFAGAMMNTGQVCVAIKRVFVHEDKYEEMLSALGDQAAIAQAGKSSSPHSHLVLIILTSSSPHPHLIVSAMGDGLAEGTKFGPINNKMQFARVSELVSRPSLQAHPVTALPKLASSASSHVSTLMLSS